MLLCILLENQALGSNCPFHNHAAKLEFPAPHPHEREHPPLELKRKKRQTLPSSFEDLLSLLSQRYNGSLFSKGGDEETRTRDTPVKKNLFGFCPTEECDPAGKYRTLGGHCNNIEVNIVFGRHSSPLRRLLPAEYDDPTKEIKKWSRRAAGFRRLLPNPRQVSMLVHSQQDTKRDKRYVFQCKKCVHFDNFLITYFTFTCILGTPWPSCNGANF